MLEYIHALPLGDGVDCALLGVGPGPVIYAETVNEEDDAHPVALTLNGERIAFDGDRLPPDAVQPQSGQRTRALNYAGPRLRGMRDAERAAQTALPLTMPTRMALIERLGLDMPPPWLLGLAESYVISETRIAAPDLYVVCRRLRFAYALADTRQDADGEPYDYDTFTLNVAHLYDAAEDERVSVADALAGLPGASLARPLDCLVHENLLYVADCDGGDPAVHVWAIARG